MNVTKQYELMTITNINVGDEGFTNVSNKVKDLISSLGGRVLDTDTWGKRKFAYEIKHMREGFYEVVDFEMESVKLEDFKRKLNLIEELVRYMVVAKDQK